MAIEKTNFTGTTQAANALELTTWLQVNATDFLENITNTDNVVTADVIGGGSVTFTPANTQSSAVNKITLKNTTYQSINRTGGARFAAAYKTSKGIWLSLVSSGTFILTKTNSNTIGVVASTSNTGKIYCADFQASTSVTELSSPVNYQSGLTALANIPLGDSDNYSDGLFGLYSYQEGGEGIMDINGVKYVKNRYLALEE